MTPANRPSGHDATTTSKAFPEKNFAAVIFRPLRQKYAWKTKSRAAIAANKEISSISPVDRSIA